MAERAARPAPVPETEAELEVFRQQWREEVSARNKKPTGKAARNVEYQREEAEVPASGPATARRKDVQDYSEDVEPNTYHDLPDKEEQLKLGVEGQNHDRNEIKEPTSALEHYERAVEKETKGQLGESIRHYRQAFRLDDDVHEAYKRKHFPPSSFVKPRREDPNPSNASATVPNTAHHSLYGSSADALPATLKQMLEEFSNLKIEAKEPPTSASPRERSPIAELPEEILTQILTELAIVDVASFARSAQVCKRLTYLVLTEESVWRRVALGGEVGFDSMHYDYAVDLKGSLLDSQDPFIHTLDSPSDSIIPLALPTPAERTLASHALSYQLLHSTYASSWRQMFRTRPRVRFNGCYISTVNYTRAGGAHSTNTLSWGAPVHVVTYFRYLRFFRDGVALSLLTTAEPADVVHHLTRENLHHHHHSSLLPSSVMKDALRGRWRLTGPLHRAGGASLPEMDGERSSTLETELEGDVVIETEGVIPAKYTYVMRLALAHAGRGTRNNKLAWKGFWSHNKLTDDWGEFGLKNYRPFYWSRVRSYEKERD